MSFLPDSVPSPFECSGGWLGLSPLPSSSSSTRVRLALLNRRWRSPGFQPLFEEITAHEPATAEPKRAWQPAGARHLVYSSLTYAEGGRDLSDRQSYSIHRLNLLKCEDFGIALISSATTPYNEQNAEKGHKTRIERTMTREEVPIDAEEDELAVQGEDQGSRG